jgi:branched-chain amino acid aminotransferase
MPSTLRVTSGPSRLTEALRDTTTFGTIFTDHMLVAEYADGRWGEPELRPYGPLPTPPVPSALHYAQSAFEGFKVHRLVSSGPGQDRGKAAIFRIHDNHARFKRSAARLCMPEVPAELFVDGIVALVRLDRDWIPSREGSALYVRPVLFGIDEELLVRPAARYRYIVLLCPVGPYFAGAVDLWAEERYVRAFPGGTGDIKPAGNYAGSLLAAREAQERGYHNVLWLDASEHRLIEECGVMNVFFVVDGAVVTPPLGGTILPGVTRDSVLTLARDLNLRVEERAIAIDELFDLHAAGRVTEAAGVGTAATVVPIGRIGWRDRHIRFEPKSPSVLERLRQELEAVRTGRKPDRHGWLTEI